MRVEANGDGLTVYVRQSWLTEYLICPERARRKLIEPEADLPTDATIIGTALHAGIEKRLTTACGYRTAADHMLSTYDMEMALPHKKTGEPGGREQYRILEAMLHRWYFYALPEVEVDDPIGVEWGFDVPLSDIEVNGVEVAIRLVGTIDYLTRHKGHDHKTCKSGFGKWKNQYEVQRWNLQSAAYYWGVLSTLDIHVPRWDFTAIAKTPDTSSKDIKTVPVMRGVGHVEWLRRQVEAIVRSCLALGTQESWPAIDTHHLCSEKWCPFWRSCKGMNVPLDLHLWKPAA